MTREEQCAELFIKGTEELIEALNQYAKTEKPKRDDITPIWFAFTRVIDRFADKCDKEIMHQQGIKLIKALKRIKNIENLMPEFQKYLHDVPDDTAEQLGEER